MRCRYTRICAQLLPHEKVLAFALFTIGNLHVDDASRIYSIMHVKLASGCFFLCFFLSYTHRARKPQRAGFRVPSHR